MASVIYNSWKLKLIDNSTKIDLSVGANTIKCALVTSSYTPVIDSHDFFDDITSEVTGTGYTAGGLTLTTSVSQDNTDDEGVFDANDAVWTSSVITARGAVIYKSTGTASTSPLICYIDFGADKSSDGGSFTITWNSEGIINLN